MSLSLFWLSSNHCMFSVIHCKKGAADICYGISSFIRYITHKLFSRIPAFITKCETKRSIKHCIYEHKKHNKSRMSNPYSSRRITNLHSFFPSHEWNSSDEIYWISNFDGFGGSWNFLSHWIFLNLRTQIINKGFYYLKIHCNHLL